MKHHIFLKQRNGTFIAFITGHKVVAALGPTPFDADCIARQIVDRKDNRWPPQPPLRAA